jgi:uncharacterized small protein (DUF1192 family)
MNSAQTIYNEALSLSDMDRAALAHNLISSLNNDVLKSVSQEEIEKRIALIHSGEAISRPAHTVFHDLRNKL